MRSTNQPQHLLISSDQEGAWPCPALRTCLWRSASAPPQAQLGRLLPRLLWRRSAPPAQGRHTAPPGTKSQQATKPEAGGAPDCSPYAHLPPSRAGSWWQLVPAGHQRSRGPKDELGSEISTCYCTPATGVETDSRPPPTSGSRGSSGAAGSRWEPELGSPGPGSPGAPGPPAEHRGSG